MVTYVVIMEMLDDLQVAILVSHRPIDEGLEAATSVLRFVVQGLVRLEPTDRGATGDSADWVGDVGAELDIEQGLV